MSFFHLCSLSLQPVRALQSSMGAEEGFMFCNSCWSEDSIKSKQMQNLSEEAHVYDCYSSQEFSNDEDYKEEQRRRKIGLANKGRVPWNKGRKHSAETRLRIKQRTIEALNDPQVRKKMAEHPRTHSEESKARIGSSVKRAWGKRLKWKRLGERFFLSWMKSIAEASRKGGSDQVELEWDSYDKIKQEIVLEQLQWAAEKAKGKEIAKVRAEKARAERIARIVQKRKELEEKEKARELKRTMKEKARQDESVADSQGMKLKQRLQMIRKKKSISSQFSINGDTSHIPALEKLNIELIKKQKMQSEVSLAEQIKAAKSRRAEPISANILAVSSSFVSYNARLKE
ncbi:2,3-bisphosphoglycerate-independent phosphoglycerate mutase [Gossypium arboreum]|uniref:2,3-bisphosphoglycerate-independent phosphoglycerate mutase n=1 Tax=Gossypium arboreum TaxID=29729 RepID=A0A0B0PKJ1_GOSAR|nr:2,3-bisphosphoglycerate-independent phosphoglycerate mutase [Gossypium arboreum]